MDHILHNSGVLHVGALRKLQVEKAHGNIVFFNQAREQLHQIWIIEVYAGHVDGYGRRVKPLVQPLAQKPAHALPHIKIHLADKAVALEHRDEQPRGQEALFRVFPAYKRLGAVRFFRGKVVFRLEIDHKLPFVQSLLHVVYYALLLQNLVAHIRLVVLYVGHIFALAFLGREGGQLQHGHDIHGRILYYVHAEAGLDKIVSVVFLQSLSYGIHLGADCLLVIRLAYAEGVRIYAGVGAGLRIFGVQAHKIGDEAQKAVALLLAPV